MGQMHVIQLQMKETCQTPNSNHPYNGSGWGDLVQYHLDGTFRFSDGMSAQNTRVNVRIG